MRLARDDSQNGDRDKRVDFVEAMSAYHKVADGPQLQTRQSRSYQSLSVDITSLMERDPPCEHLMTVSGHGPIVSAALGIFEGARIATDASRVDYRSYSLITRRLLVVPGRPNGTPAMITILSPCLAAP